MAKNRLPPDSITLNDGQALFLWGLTEAVGTMTNLTGEQIDQVGGIRSQLKERVAALRAAKAQAPAPVNGSKVSPLEPVPAGA